MQGHQLFCCPVVHSGHIQTGKETRKVSAGLTSSFLAELTAGHLGVSQSHVANYLKAGCVACVN
jgi:hypothetical protein